jgi:hypothetical protein
MAETEHNVSFAVCSSLEITNIIYYVNPFMMSASATPIPLNYFVAVN